MLRGTWRGLIVSEGGVAVAVVVTSGGVDVEVRVKDWLKGHIPITWFCELALLSARSSYNRKYWGTKGDEVVVGLGW